MCRRGRPCGREGKGQHEGRGVRHFIETDLRHRRTGPERVLETCRLSDDEPEAVGRSERPRRQAPRSFDLGEPVVQVEELRPCAKLPGQRVLERLGIVGHVLALADVAERLAGGEAHRRLAAPIAEVHGARAVFGILDGHQIARPGLESLALADAIGEVLGIPLGVREHAAVRAQHRLHLARTGRVVEEAKVLVVRRTVDLLDQLLASAWEPEVEEITGCRRRRDLRGGGKEEDGRCDQREEPGSRTEGHIRCSSGQGRKKPRGPNPVGASPRPRPCERKVSGKHNRSGKASHPAAHSGGAKHPRKWRAEELLPTNQPGPTNRATWEQARFPAFAPWHRGERNGLKMEPVPAGP